MQFWRGPGVGATLLHGLRPLALWRQISEKVIEDSA